MHTLVASRVAFFLVLALIGASADATAAHRTLAYFTAASAQAGNMSTVRLDVSSSASVSGVFNIAANMLPGDFQVKTFDIVNGGAPGVAQQDFTYAVASTSRGGGNTCSLLDSSDPPTCSTPAAPSATSTTGAAFVLLRCTTNATATTPLACSAPNVYVTQIYPQAGAGTQRQIAAGLSRATIGGVATGASYAIDIAGTAFTGGPLVISSPVALGGPDPIAGADGQTHGLAASRTDYLASVTYLPSQAGANLANQTSVLTFTWTATQRLGSTR